MTPGALVLFTQKGFHILAPWQAWLSARFGDGKRGSGRCHELFPVPPAPREVAGGPIGGHILKCQLQPVDAAAYEVSFSAEESARLDRVFPTGVCDWTQPGVEQIEPLGTWLTFDAT